MGGQGRNRDFRHPFDIGQEMGVIPQEEGKLPEGIYFILLNAHSISRERYLFLLSICIIYIPIGALFFDTYVLVQNEKKRGMNSGENKT